MKNAGKKLTRSASNLQEVNKEKLVQSHGQGTCHRIFPSLFRGGRQRAKLPLLGSNGHEGQRYRGNAERAPCEYAVHA